MYFNNRTPLITVFITLTWLFWINIIAIIIVNNNSPIQDYVHQDDQTQPTFEMTPEFKPFTVSRNCWC